MVGVVLSEAILSALACGLAWATLYFALCLADPKRSYEWHVRMITVIHALAICCLCAWCSFVQGPWPFSDPGGPNTPLQHQTCVLCLGYFLFDFSWCLYFKTEGPVMLMHHSLSIVGITWTILVGKYGTEMVATILGSELSNPFLQLRWFLRESGQYDTWLADVNDVVFMTVFGTLRLGVGSYLLYCYMNNPVPDLFGKVGGCCIYSIGWIFWFSIVRFAIRKYSKKYRKLTSGRTVCNSHGAILSNGNAKTKSD